MHNLKNLITVLALFLISTVNLLAQNTENKIPVNFYIGGSYTIAPSFDIDGIWTVNASTSAKFYSIFADLTINQNLIGRVQLSFLSIPSLSEGISEQLNSGFQMNGSLGYNYQLPSKPKISLPIMATLGYATVVDNSARDAGMQVGGTVGLNYTITDRVNASSSIRYLKGLKFNDGAKFSQIDFSVGVQIRVF